MIRTVIYMGLMAMSVFVASCCVQFNMVPLFRTMYETLNQTKKEVGQTIELTTQKVQCNEVDFHVGNKIIDSLTKTIKIIDTQLAVLFQLEKTGTREEVFQFAERTNLIIEKALTTLKTLHDLYDISTHSQFKTATFFATDSFNIRSEKTDEAKKAIEPIAQRIVRFIGDHPRQKFEAVIVCSGSLADQEQNVSLCELKAQTVANLLIEQIKSYEEFIPNPQLIHYNIKWVIKEETSPNLRRTEQYKVEDKHPGMVSLTWHLLPASLYAGSADY